MPRKGGPGITGSDLLVVNKVCFFFSSLFFVDLFGEEREMEADEMGVD